MTGLVIEPLVLLCPSCDRQHVDEGDLATTPHVEHVCLYCGHEWRPREHATVGVPAGELSPAWLFDVAVVHGAVAEKQIVQRWRWREARPMPSSTPTIPPPPAFGVPVLRSFDPDPNAQPMKLGPYREVGSRRFDVHLPGDADA